MATSIFKEYFRGYEILGELGRGNARVLKARSIHTGELVAIKHFAFNTEPDAIRRFQRESEIMKSIQHDNIVKIIEVHLDAELPYIVMQLVEGGDLRSLLRTYGTLDVPTVIRLAVHMTEALDAIHANSVVHRDVKPENIMYRKLPGGDIQFLLTDFGIAKLREQSDSLTVTGSSMLTYDYASPEQFNQSKTVSTPTDYYSLGIVLYECLTGKVPFEFEQDDLLMHIHRVISSPVPEPRLPVGRALPPAMYHLLEALTAKQPLNRLSDAVSVRRLLRIALIEDLRGAQVATVVPEPVSPKKTLKNNGVVVAPAAAAVPSHPTPKKSRDLFFITGLLFLIGGAIFFSWKALVKPEEIDLPVSKTTRNLEPLVMEIKHTDPINTDLISVSHPGYTPVTFPAANTAVQETPAPAAVELPNGVYLDDFSSAQDSMWDTGRDENSEYSLFDGKYVMTGFADSLSYSSSVKFNLDIQKDFTIAAYAAHLGDSTSDPFGINFCGDEDQDAYYVFYITSNGFYSIGASVQGQWNVIVDWTESKNIHKDAGVNILSVEKQGDVLRFYINGRVENLLPFTGGYGNYFGMRVDGAQTVSFDQFLVKGNQ